MTPRSSTDQPNLGSRAWIGPALALGLVGLTLRGPLVAPGIIGGEIETDLALNAGGMSLLTTIPVLLFAVAAPLAAAIVSRVGARTGLVLGMLLVAAASVWRVADGLVPLFAGTVLLGLGLTMGNVAAPVLVKERVPLNRMSTATGIYTASLNIGSVLAALATAPLAEWVGWQGALGAWAVLALIGTLPWVWTRRDTKRQYVRESKRTIVRPRRGTALLMVAFAGQGLAYFSLIAWLPSILASTLAVGVGAAGFASALFQVTAIVGAISTTPLSRLIGSSRLFVVIAAGWATLPLTLLFAPGVWWLGAALAGWAQGATVTLVFALIAERTRTLPESAWLAGRVQFVGYGAGALGPLLFEGLHSVTGSWTVSLVLVLVGSGMIAIGGVGAARRFVAPETEPARVVDDPAELPDIPARRS